MILAVCSTPFQMQNLLTMNKTLFEDEKADVILLDHASVNHSIYQKLKETQTFNEVFFAQTKHMSNGGKSRFQLIRDLVELKHFLNKDEIVNQVPFKQLDYDKVLVPSDDPPSQVFWYHVKQHNPAAELYVYEDGTKSYRFFDGGFTPFKSFYLNRLFGMGFFEEVKGAYLHHPEYTVFEQELEFIRIPPLNKRDPEVREVMNDVFAFDQEKGTIRPQTRFIFFDQAFQFESELKEQARLFQLIEQAASQEELVVKLHPRTDRHVYNQTLTGDYPFEIMEINNDISEKVLISGVSTACLSPKLVFDEEPYVILLYKLLRSPIFQESQKGYFEFAEKVQADYRQKDRFFIPETEEELVEIVHDLSSKQTVKRTTSKASSISSISSLGQLKKEEQNDY